MFKFLKCLNPKYWKTHYSKIINIEDLAIVKLGCNDKYYIKVYVYKFDTYMDIDGNFDTIEDAIQKIKESDMYSETHSFEWALKQLKSGSKVARKGWNGKGMFIFLVPGSTFKASKPPLTGIYPEGTEIEYHAHIDMKTAQGYIVPWLASQTDILANDWVIAD